MKNFKQSGHVISHTPAADIASGDVVVIGSLVGIATGDITSGKEGEVALTGVYEVAKEAALAVAQGDTVYWDDAADEADKTNTNTEMGTAVAAAAGADTTVLVLLKQGPASFN